MTIKLSNSEIQTFKDCRRKWWLTYYRELGLKAYEPTGARALGTNVHEALAAWYEFGKDPIQVITDLYGTQIDLVASQGLDTAKIRKDADLALAMVQGYLPWVEETAQDHGLEFIGAEQVIEVPILDDAVILRGKLDARFERKADGARLFMDHKTCQSISELSRILPMNEQMKFYHLLEYLDSKGAQRTDGALFNMLRKVKRTAAARPPFYERIHLQHNKAVLESTWTRTIAVAKEILEVRHRLDNGEDHQAVVFPRPNGECTWKCDFQPMCAMFDDGSNIEGLLAEYYHRVDPHERYNEERIGQ